MRYLVLSELFFATLFFEAAHTTPVEARRYCPDGGYCHPGTCTKYNPGARIQYACKAANCSAANCRR
jgi:hypothetical protein